MREGGLDHCARHPHLDVHLVSWVLPTIPWRCGFWLRANPHERFEHDRRLHKETRVVANRSALIVGLSGPEVTEAESRFLAEARPAGIILFARNLESHEQIKRLVGDARAAIGGDATLVLIDQEGGRVQRLRPPLGRRLPSAANFAALYQTRPDEACRAARLVARLVAQDLAALGIDTNCAPVLDLPAPGAHEIIGDRAYGDDVAQVVALGSAVAEGLIAGAVLPVIKHIPGHGRADADSHLALPTVDTPRHVLEATDFAPFRALAGMPAAMTAHVVFSDIDKDHAASISPTVIGEIIRDHIGFDGLLMSDDLSMHALSGNMRRRAEAVIAAGSDVALHCNGELAEMQEAASAVPVLEGAALRRFRDAVAVTLDRSDYDRKAAELALESVLAGQAAGVESV